MALMKRVAKVLPGRLAGGGGAKVARATINSAGTRVKFQLPEVELADEPNEVLESFETQALWIYSEPGRGKTTLTAQFPGVHQLCFEPGATYLETYQRPVNHWLEFVAYKEKFKVSKFQFLTIDIVEEAFDLCFNFMCEEVLKIDHPNDEKDYGKSWGAIYTEFIRQMHDLIKIPGKGCIFVSHSCERKFTPAFGEPYDLIRPALGSKVLERLLGVCHMMGYIYYCPIRKQNVMRMRPDGTVMAKTRPDNLFLHTDGTQVWDIPLGHDAASAYQAYHDAFHNKLPVWKERAEAAKPKLLLKRKK